jgi:CCR4-NOT transcription complex subunit 7/8
MVSGLVLNPDVHWVCFHGSYDFAYLLSVLINTVLPETEDEFTQELVMYFPSHFDIRILVKGNDYLHGGLNRIANTLEVFRVGKTHQAGSDSVVTIDVFFKLIKNGTIDKNVLEDNMNVIYGIGNGADDQETIQYTKFSNDGAYDYMNHLSNQGGLGLGMNMPQQNIQGLHYSNMFANAGHVDYYGSMNLNGTNQQQQQQQQQRYYQANVGNASAGGNMMGGKYSQARLSMNGVGNGKKDYGKVIAN